MPGFDVPGALGPPQPLTRPRVPGAPGIIVVRCNPFGHTTGPGGDRGPRHLMGGLYPAAFEGGKKWFCPNRADGRYRMTCQCDPPHRGQEMPLCYSHVAMIGRRMAGICPPCVMPPAALELHERIQAAQAGAAMLIRGRADRDTIARAVSEADQLGRMMTELVERGIAHRCQLTLTEISLHSHKNRGLGHGDHYRHTQMGERAGPGGGRQGPGIPRGPGAVRRRPPRP